MIQPQSCDINLFFKQILTPLHSADDIAMCVKFTGTTEGWSATAAYLSSPLMLH